MVQAAKTLGQGPTFPIMQLSRIVFFCNAPRRATEDIRQQAIVMLS